METYAAANGGDVNVLLLNIEGVAKVDKVLQSHLAVYIVARVSREHLAVYIALSLFNC